MYAGNFPFMSACSFRSKLCPSFFRQAERNLTYSIAFGVRAVDRVLSCCTIVAKIYTTNSCEL